MVEVSVVCSGFSFFEGGVWFSVGDTSPGGGRCCSVWRFSDVAGGGESSDVGGAGDSIFWDGILVGSVMVGTSWRDPGGSGAFDEGGVEDGDDA